MEAPRPSDEVTQSSIGEEAARVAAERMRFATNALPALIAYLDTDGRYVWVNDGYCRWFGRPREAFLGRHPREMLGDAGWTAIEPYVERVLRGEEVAFDNPVVHGDRGPRIVRASYVPHRDDTGRVRGFVVLVTDISEMKNAETALRRAREQLQLVVDSTSAFIARYDREQRLVWTNQSYAARFGKTPDELVGCRLVDLVGETAFRVVAPLCARVLAGESIEMELEIPYATGSRFVHMCAAPTRDANGAADGAVAVLTDVTDGRLLEQERERALNDLRDADRRKDEFLAMLSHELRNPLGAILNAGEVLARLQSGSEDPATKYAEVVARQARHMQHLLDDLLDVSRVSRGTIQLQKERLELNALLRQAVEGRRPMIAEKRHELSLALAPQPISVEADPTRLVQVIDNLLDNAAKYTDAGGHIAIVSTVEDGEAVVTVRDDGVGMAPDLLARAFDLFVQGTRSLERKQGGLGVGLTLVRTLVEMHGGSVRASSEGPGRGSELEVRLPLALPAEVELASARPTPAAPGAASAPLRVLVIDDNVDAAEGLGDLLRLLGHEVALAHDGPAALAVAEVARPDLVLLDIGLPVMDGYAVAAKLRAAGHPRAALVALTGYGREDDLRRSRDAGFDRHLVKPIDFDQLSRLSVEFGGRRL